MPLTPAEKMRRYRERLKLENPEKFEVQRKKNLQRIKSKYKYKKIAELAIEEQEIQRKKWRDQKKKTLKDTPAPAVDVVNPIINEDQSHEIKKMQKTIQRITRSRNIYRNNFNYAKSRMVYYKRLTENLRKKVYRIQLEHTKIEERLKTRNEVLEVSLKNAYNQCASYKEKDVFKTITKDEAVKENRAQCVVGKALGLKGRIRKTLETSKGPKLKPSIVKFFLRDDVTRATAGKRECRTKRKKKRQIRLLNNTLQRLYVKYKKEGGLASFASFCRYKPFYILAPSLKNCNTCLCVKHSNINFKLTALKRAGVFDHNDMTALLKSVVCDINKYECMYEICENCKSKSLPYNSEQYLQSEEITWLMWELVDHKYKKKCAEGSQIVQTKKTTKSQKTDTIANLIKIFEADFKKFKIHHYNMSHQTDEYNKCLENLRPGEAAIHCDFSENFECKMSSEIQAMHFGASKNQVTLHTGVLFLNKKKQSFCTISPSNVHQPHAIWAHLTPILDLAKSMDPDLHVVHIFSDGPSSQYRQKNNFYLIRHFATTRNIKITWSFFESGHGKGVADAIGGIVKRALDRQVAYGKDVTDASDAYNVLERRVKSVKCYYINDQDIDKIYKVLPKSLKTLPGTMSIHQVITLEGHQIKHRILSCFCGGLDDCSCFDPKVYQYSNTSTVNYTHNQTELGPTKSRRPKTSNTDVLTNEAIKENIQINDIEHHVFEKSVLPEPLSFVTPEMTQPNATAINTDLMNMDFVFNDNTPVTSFTSQSIDLKSFSDEILVEIQPNTNLNSKNDFRRQGRQSSFQTPEGRKPTKVIITSDIRLNKVPEISKTAGKSVGACDKKIQKMNSLQLTTTSTKLLSDDVSNTENVIIEKLNNRDKKSDILNLRIRGTSKSSSQSCHKPTSVQKLQTKSLRSMVNRYISCKQCKQPMLMHEVSRCITCNCYFCQDCEGKKSFRDYIICANCFKS